MDHGVVPMTREYWFARRFPVGNPRNAYAPVHWKGWAAAGIFVVALLIGAAGFAWMAATGHFVQGAVVFAVAAIVGLVWFVTIAQVKGDRTRTVEEYRKMQRV